MHILTIKVQWPQMTPKWPLTPDFFFWNMCTLSLVTLCLSVMKKKWWKNIICQQTEKCLVYELWAFENGIFLYFTCKWPVKNCRIALIIRLIRPNFGYMMRNLKSIILREKNYFKKIVTSDDLGMWPLNSWTYAHHFVGKQSLLKVKMKKAFVRQK